MNHNLMRQFTQEVNGETIIFDVEYNPKTHHFTVTENTLVQYTLIFDPITRTWITTDGPEPSLPINELAALVQQSFGVFV